METQNPEDVFGTRARPFRPLSEFTDEELATAHLEGVPRAFQELYERYQPRLHRFVRRKIEDRERAQDLAQETFIRVLRHLPRFQTDKKFSTWIFTIAANLAKNEFRNRSRSPLILFQHLESGRGPDDRPLEFKDPTQQPDRLYRKRDLQRLVGEAVKALKPKHRLIFHLREMEGKSYREISRITGAALGTVKSRMHRARKAFRDEIEPLLRS
jgi:RNA polymerase sigma-70 factor (ECF subfamily)